MADIPTPTPATPTEIAKAREFYQNDDIEIDDNATVSRTDGGRWVSAWVWIADSDMESDDG
jgi:hypothetical protein